jgi:hypothetical protein
VCTKAISITFLKCHTKVNDETGSFDSNAKRKCTKELLARGISCCEKFSRIDSDGVESGQKKREERYKYRKELTLGFPPI